MSTGYTQYTFQFQLIKHEVSKKVRQMEKSAISCQAAKYFKIKLWNLLTNKYTSKHRCSMGDKCSRCTAILPPPKVV